MNEAEFIAETEALFVDLEDAIDNSDAELDYESSSGVLTIDCEDTGTQVIVSRQIAMMQIWVAAKSGGYHLEKQGDTWCTTTNKESLLALLNRVLSEQSNGPVELSL